MRLSPDVAERACRYPDDRPVRCRAFVVPREGTVIDADVLDDLCRAHLGAVQGGPVGSHRRSR